MVASPTQVESLQRKFASIHLTLAQQQEQAAGAKPGTTQVQTTLHGGHVKSTRL